MSPLSITKNRSHHKLSITVSRSLLYLTISVTRITHLLEWENKVLSHIKINHFDTKDGGACEDAAKKSEQSLKEKITNSKNIIQEYFLYDIYSII